MGIPRENLNRKSLWRNLLCQIRIALFVRGIGQLAREYQHLEQEAEKWAWGTWQFGIRWHEIEDELMIRRKQTAKEKGGIVASLKVNTGHLFPSEFEKVVTGLRKELDALIEDAAKKALEKEPLQRKVEALELIKATPGLVLFLKRYFWPSEFDPSELLANHEFVCFHNGSPFWFSRDYLEKHSLESLESLIFKQNEE